MNAEIILINYYFIFSFMFILNSLFHNSIAILKTSQVVTLN